jgi:TldD protein
LTLIFFAATSLAQSQQDALLSIVESELNREMTEFKKINQPPYFLAYRIYDTQSGYLSSSFGSLTGSDSDRSRILVTDLKVGDYSFDNSHPISNYEDFEAFDMPGARDAVELPLDNKL